MPKNTDRIDFQEHAKEKDRKRMEQYNNVEDRGRELKERSRKMRENDKIILIK